MLASCVAGLLATGACLAQSPSADPVVAVVNGTEIRESDVRIAEEDYGRTLPAVDEATRRERLINYLTDSILLSAAASGRKIGDEAEIAQRMAHARNKALMSKMLEAAAAEVTGDEDALRKIYDELVLKAPKTPEYHLRVILIPFASSEDEAAVKAAERKARAALERISKGEDFAAVAADVSDDPAAKANGGDFGFRTLAELGKEYAEQVPLLKEGGVSPLIRTGFGWHIIKLEGQRIRSPIPFEQIRDRLQTVAARKAQLDLISSLRSQAKIERRDRPNESDKGGAVTR